MKNIKIYLLAVLITGGAWTMYQSNRPTIYLIGDSTEPKSPVSKSPTYAAQAESKFKVKVQ